MMMVVVMLFCCPATFSFPLVSRLCFLLRFPSILCLIFVCVDLFLFFRFVFFSCSFVLLPLSTQSRSITSVLFLLITSSLILSAYFLSIPLRLCLSSSLLLGISSREDGLDGLLLLLLLLLLLPPSPSRLVCSCSSLRIVSVCFHVVIFITERRP